MDNARNMAVSMKDLATPYPVLDPTRYPPATMEPMDSAQSVTAWQTLTFRGGELNFNSATIDFIPRSRRWRFTLATGSTPEATDKRGRDHSYIKVNLWMGEKDASGLTGLRIVRIGAEKLIAGTNYGTVHAIGAGGDTGIMEFQNGLFTNGTPRPFRLTLTGNFIDYRLTIEDLGETQTPPVKPIAVEPKN